MRGSTSRCSIHSTELCARYCKRCNTAICPLCVSSGKHKHQKTEHISKMADSKKEPRKMIYKQQKSSLSLCINNKRFIFFLGVAVGLCLNYAAHFFTSRAKLKCSWNFNFRLNVTSRETVFYSTPNNVFFKLCFI